MAKENKRDAPVLIELDEAAVTDWVKQYEAYVKRGGSRRPRDCIDADVLAAAKLFGVDVKSQGGTVEELAADDGRFLNELRAIYAACPEKFQLDSSGAKAAITEAKALRSNLPAAVAARAA